MSSLIQSLEATDVLLGEIPKMRVARRYKQDSGQRVVQLRVDRSLPFEPVAGHLDAFLGLTDRHVELSISAYDPALTAAVGRAPSSPTGEHVQILWLDWPLHRQNASPGVAVEWLTRRIADIRGAGAAGHPILVNDWPLGVEQSAEENEWYVALGQRLQAAIEDLPGVYPIGLADLAESLGEDFWDLRNHATTKFPFSSRAAMAIARRLGAVLVPGVLDPRIKVIALGRHDTRVPAK